MLAHSHGRRSIAKALGAVSPLAFADAVERYITALPAEDVRALAAHSIKHFDAAERVQFGMFLGYETHTGTLDEPLTGGGMSAKELQRLIDGCDGFLPNRFAAFLRENRRAIPALGDETLRRILATLPEAQFDESSTPGDVPKRRLPIPVAAIVALTLLVAVAPLVAQYAHQRGMIAGPAVFVAPQIQPVRVAARAANAKSPAAQVKHAAAPRPVHRPPAAVKTARAKAVAAAPRRVARHEAARTYGRRRSGHRAVAWKFDPSQNPYFTRRWHRVRVVASAPPARVRAAAPPATMSAFEARARLAVASYLDAVIAGDTPRALQHLGMPAGADPKAISESPIISRDARAQIVGVKPGENGQTRVQVDIMSRRGEYFEIFWVARDGPAVRIADRYFIPVNRTAEEISARLLAKTTH